MRKGRVAERQMMIIDDAQQGSSAIVCSAVALVSLLAISGCFPAPRAYRIFLPPAEAKRDIEERLAELQQRCDRDDLTDAECTRRRQELLAEMDLYKRYQEKSVLRSQ